MKGLHIILRPLIYLVLVSFSLYCSSKPKAVVNEEKTNTNAKNTPALPEPNLDPSLLPLGALAQIDSIALEARPPCEASFTVLQTMFSVIRENRIALSIEPTKKNSMQFLTKMSDLIQATLNTLPTHNEDSEFRQRNLELKASLLDLSESLASASQSLTKNNKDTSLSSISRIENGVHNIRVSIQSLTRHCQYE